ncbi:cytochrome o ubiquinol oxidase subunit I [Cupriavidus gilardii]|uniref:Cytochrome o ubiquinol oxidase subunit I n=1 Tax=Cupriavidus gilardii TaxID=82541 RepID=A0A6N1BAP4_9BURK|nr:cytochrome o ubiquinol oxidase subunit I [Cupriavidus gilardii]ALD92472.1 cytochrome o ubiquinol oxidase subunit I 2 [Cupriavidus gilardii CR3]QQE09322.1 cytochrome o ubiquinol oxidase subunit I [Cupriavidus sp. ISTL7]KAB0596459.1 cytochrome o ubiquinol oxidase subunit I [Cupriavidus gilardii]MCT9016589.1 cytochrome o ubiquinol oxidase subunit I [Cupriavidus gilardii]MCT9052988.1 cytochrome o ubiquinol oxidase subunit I [Cupriavidus gilardii]
MLDSFDLTKLIFGRLSWEAIPLHEPILIATFAAVVLGGLTLVGALTYFRAWGYLWREWFTSIDHKKIGIMYMVLGLVMLLRGFADAIMMRLQQAIAFGDNMGYLPPHHYDQIFTAHGVIMIFFVAMPLVTGLMNYVVPLQIGARDVAFPFLNNFSFWMTTAGAVLVMVSLFVGEFAKTGWLAYPPLSGILQSPDVGVDYYIWALQIAGIGTLLSGVNLLVTIVKMRAPGMTMMKMPVFTWTSLCTNVLIVAAFPVLTAVLALLSLDRYVGTNFFTNDFGGNPMMYVNLIWIWGHPEVYILILPAFGIFSEVVSTFCRKRLFGYASMVYATVVITVLSYLVWLHHFFTMGSGASVNSFFGITTMIISIPTGAKIFNWLFTMYRGRIRFEVPMLWTVGFMVTFVIGGMTGVLLAVPPADFVLHNSLFLIAHFHNVIIGGVLFGLFAGINYWFPKAFGFKLDDFWGKVSFWFWLVGFYAAFMPLYVLGLMGVTRRVSHFTDPSLQIWFQVAAVGAFLIAIGIAAFLIQLVVSFKRRAQLRDVTGDPWDGRTLEWSTSSPPPAYNFAFTPVVHDNDAWWQMKDRGYERPQKGFLPIHMPKNTGAGIILAGLSTVLGFALIWHMWLPAAVAFVALLAVAIGHTFNYQRDYYIPAEHVVRTEEERTRLLAQHA